MILIRERIICFVDGFNLYHALLEIGVNKGAKSQRYKNEISYKIIRAAIEAHGLVHFFGRFDVGESVAAAAHRLLDKNY